MFELVLDASLRSTIAAVAVAAVLAVCRVRSGAPRHAAWAAVLVAMLAMPILVAVVPGLVVPVAFADGWSPEPVRAPIAPAPPRDPSPAGEPSFATAALPAAVAPATDIPAPQAAASDRLRAAIVLLFGAGVIFNLIRLAAGWTLVRRLVRGAARVPGNRRVPILETPVIATPMTAGIMRPCVLLPLDWRQWPEGTLRAVLAHEHAHIIRRDAIVALLARLNRAVFWFHPLAWWLQRTLAAAAEHACDEAAADEMGHPRRYAEVLVHMAAVVRRRGHRVAWQALGISGPDRFDARIERLLNGEAMIRTSVTRRVAAAAGCVATLVLAIACRQQVAAAPLRPDPAVQQQIDARNARIGQHQKAVTMTTTEAAALERSLEAAPDDVEARESLILFYDQSGKVSWEQKRDGIRRHTLWRITHMPDTDLWIPAISRRYDPEGYAQAKALWLSQASQPTVTAKTLGQAAAFFTADDKPAAGALLMRAARMEPSGPWNDRLMDLYASTIADAAEPRTGGVDAETARFAADAERQIEAITDPARLAAAAMALGHRARVGTSATALSLRLLGRVVELDPQNVRARAGLAAARTSERRKAIQDRLRAAGAAPTAFGDFTAPTADEIAALSVDDRLFYLADAAEIAYTSAEYVDYTTRGSDEAAAARGRQQADQGFALARQDATEVLSLARDHAQAAVAIDAVYRAETVLGVLAIKDGDRKAAVEHMRAAGSAPAPDPPPGLALLGLRSRLVEYLLRAGERESVAQYLEQSANRTPLERTALLADAARVRDGMMPVSYQYAEARH